ncbi:transposase [Candidatus Binatia bacterium]|nr:transposase [Candidatus Binatia bacterium]
MQAGVVEEQYEFRSAPLADRRLQSRLCTLYGAVPGRRGQAPFQAQMADSAAVSAWRRRMGTARAREIYKQRAPTAERVNADVRTYRTMDRMVVRGVGKVLCVALWNALALNLVRWFALTAVS